ncbi:MAG: alginate lyase family protein [Bacteroidales bacterium]
MKIYSILNCILIICLLISAPAAGTGSENQIKRQAIRFLRTEIIIRADKVLYEKPLTVTSAFCERSAGGIHDFYSEGDYWWPDPDNPEGPYIQRDGMTNPANFVEHRRVMIRLSQITGTLASAYKITGNEKYVNAAFVHLKAWFSDTATMMNPSLNFAQAIKGRFTGRGTGIIDTVHLLEVAQAILIMENANCVDKELLAGIKLWFSKYLKWLMTHQYSMDEMNAKNNHATCWVMQVAEFARLTSDENTMEFCRKRYREILLPDQMAENGSFPQELRRTKPYGYSLFNLDAMTMVCTILSDKNNDLLNYQTPDGKSLRKGIEFLYPFVADKNKWAFNRDVMYWDNWPVAHPFLVLGAYEFNMKTWFKTWKLLEHFPVIDEVIRNMPVRNPIIWMN